MKLTLNVLEKRSDDAEKSWPSYMFGGRIRTSTLLLIVVFLAVWWVYDTYRPEAAPKPPAPQVVPPGFVPDPNYTWVPRSRVQEPTATFTPTPITTVPPSPTTTVPDDHHCAAAVPAAAAAVSAAGTLVSADLDPDPIAPAAIAAEAGFLARIWATPAVGHRGPAKFTATLGCRDDHPRPCQQEVQSGGASGAG